MPDTAGLGDLWISAARLVECCDITIHVVASPQPGWRVVVRDRAAGQHAEGIADHILEALAIAIGRAEVAGFVLPTL